MASVGFPQMSEMRTQGAAWEVESGEGWRGTARLKGGEIWLTLTGKCVYCLSYLTFKP